MWAYSEFWPKACPDMKQAEKLKDRNERIPEAGITIITVAPRLLPFGGRPAVGFGPKLEEMNPRTFPDLPIYPRTLDFDQKTSKITPRLSGEKFEKSKKSLIIALYYPIIIIPAMGCFTFTKRLNILIMEAKSWIPGIWRPPQSRTYHMQPMFGIER